MSSAERRLLTIARPCRSKGSASCRTRADTARSPGSPPTPAAALRRRSYGCRMASRGEERTARPSSGPDVRVPDIQHTGIDLLDRIECGRRRASNSSIRVLTAGRSSLARRDEGCRKRHRGRAKEAAPSAIDRCRRDRRKRRTSRCWCRIHVIALQLHWGGESRRMSGQGWRSHRQPCPMRNGQHRGCGCERSAHPGDKLPAPKARTTGHTCPRSPAGAAAVSRIHACHLG